MILETLEIENVGIYSGVHRFNLFPDPDGTRPIILVTGHNGGGKTTFLESVRLALYGKRTLGTRIAQSQYETYLLKKIHIESPKKFARVLLRFARVEEGKTRKYEIVRAWAARGASVVESLELTCDGSVVPDLPPEDWQSYIEDLVPPGVSQLFFFDGEKIQNFADTQSYEGIKDSIRMLFGLDLVEQLRTDLALYAARKDQQSAHIDLEALQLERVDLDEAIRLAEQERADTSSRRDQILGRLRRAERVFRNEGGRCATSREQLQETLLESVRERERLLLALKDLAGDVLPLSLAPALTQRLRHIVRQAQLQANSAALTAFIDAFEAHVPTGKSNFAVWTDKHFDTLRNFAHQERTNNSFSLDEDPEYIANRLERLTTLHRMDAAKLAAKLDHNASERKILDQQLQGFDVGLARDALDDLKAAERERGTIEAEINQHDRAIQELRNRRDALEAESRRCQQAVLKRARRHHSRDIAAQAAAALIEYEEQLLEARVASIKRHFAECFKNLIRKPNLISSIALDKQTFDFTLVGVDGKTFPHDTLSAGERQIFAVSMLWALGKTSGRHFPILIDTPLSRLDLRHRQTFLESFVTAASHQVILLCTDTEMTPDLEQIVRPYVSTAYQLHVGAESRSTTSLPRFASQQTDLVDAYQ